MDKRQADKIIVEYTDKIYGFCLGKTGNIDKAQELAANVTLEVYSSLLKADEIGNVNAYIWRISQNVYARYVDSDRKSAHLSLDGISGEMSCCDDNIALSLENSEMCRLIRREITYLSETQRKIVVMHYYDGMLVREIAESLKLPEGTVKWHLYDAKNNLKEGIFVIREKGALGLNPIEFCSMGHDGWPGPNGDTKDFLKKRIAQNIAYAAYRQPKTVNEIADELGVSPIFVNDELAPLVEYDFIDDIGGGKYRTNIYITDMTADTEERLNLLYNKAADRLIERYIPRMLDSIAEIAKRSDIYIPDNDENLLKFTLTIFRLSRLHYNEYGKDETAEKYAVERPDGGKFIAFAVVNNPVKLSFDSQKYGVCGAMTRGSYKYAVRSWQMNTYYDNRKLGWRDNNTEDFEYLHEYMSGTLDKTPANIDKYRRLCDKGYIDDDNVRVIVAKSQTGGMHGDLESMSALLPSLDSELAEYGMQIDKEYFDIVKPLYPEHMHGLCKCYSKNVLSQHDVVMRVIERMFERGMLAPFKENQKGGLSTLVFSDILPE